MRPLGKPKNRWGVTKNLHLPLGQAGRSLEKNEKSRPIFPPGGCAIGRTMKKAVSWLLRPAPMGVLGLITGFLVKMLDIHCYAQHFGVSLSDIFSQAGVWVVIGVAISLYSRDNRTAMANIFLFCAGMLLTYYITAEVTNSIYGWSFIKAWAAFACLSPLMAYLVRLTLRPGALALVLKLGVFAGYVGMNLLLGSFLHTYDIPFLAVLVYWLFGKRWGKAREE